MRAGDQILIAGVGNVLLGDDGVGVHAVRELEKNPIPGVTMVDVGTAILHGLHFLEKAERALIIDAARGGRAPGTIYLFDHHLTAESTIVSIHSLGLREAVRLLPADKAAPAITVLGVEPGLLDYGMELSAPVQAAVPRVVGLAWKIVTGWLEKYAEVA